MFFSQTLKALCAQLWLGRRKCRWLGSGFARSPLVRNRTQFCMAFELWLFECSVLTPHPRCRGCGVKESAALTPGRSACKYVGRFIISICFIRITWPMQVCGAMGGGSPRSFQGERVRSNEDCHEQVISRIPAQYCSTHAVCSRCSCRDCMSS